MKTRVVRAAIEDKLGSKQRGQLHAEPFIFAVAVLLQLVPLSVMPYVITTDGPSHVAGAWVLGHYSDADSGLLRQYYQVDFFPSPNLLTECLLAGLMRIVSPAGAEKLLVAGYLVAFPVAVRYAIRSINRSAGWLGFLALPLTFNYLFFSGFYNFCYGVVLSMFTMGFVWRHRRRWDLWSSLILALLLLLTYGTHLLPFAMTLLFIATMVAWDVLPEARRQRRSGISWSSVAGNLGGYALPPLLAVLPALILMAAFLARFSEAGPLEIGYKPLVMLLAGLATPVVVVLTTYVRAEILLSFLLMATIVSLVIAAVREAGRDAVRGVAAPLAGLVIFAVVLYGGVPDEVGTLSYIGNRLGLYVVLFVLLWLAVQPSSRRMRWLACGTALAVAFGLVLVRFPVEGRYNTHVHEFMSARQVLRPGSTLVTLRFWVDTPPFARFPDQDPLLHITSRLAVESKGVDINHLDAWYSYFPVQFRREYNLRHRFGPHFNELKSVSEWSELLKDDRTGRIHIDYVLLWGTRRPDQRVREDPRLVEVMDQLTQRYRLTYVSEPLGLVEVYEHR
ncbi:MAG: hypothetical protein M3302_02230 [Actinomycetota bacterium]|nr:hypothetical protein [Actinomycetota bacterium]